MTNCAKYAVAFIVSIFLASTVAAGQVVECMTEEGHYIPVPGKHKAILVPSWWVVERIYYPVKKAKEFPKADKADEAPPNCEEKIVVSPNIPEPLDPRCFEVQ